MTKKVLLSILGLTLVLSIFFTKPLSIEAKTLRDMYKSLDELKNDYKEQEQKKKEAQNRIKTIDNSIRKATKEIEDCEKKIEESKAKIKELDAEIIEKDKEIKELISFLQVADGNNAYLEYVFGAQTFTDFIYRSAVVEQLTEYNDKLINEMNDLIEENKQQQIELANRQKEQERLIEKLKKELKKVNVNLADITEDSIDLKAQIKAQEEVIKYYKDVMKCDMDQDVNKCVNVPYANGMIRPTKKGSITSNFGYRVHPVSGVYKFHNAVDIGVSEGTPVYAAAGGRVAALQKKASCGGNGVYVHHNIGGVQYTTLYLHLKSINVKVGDIVEVNSIVGYSGGGKSTPWDKCTTGPHLHFALGKGWYLGSGYTSYTKWINSCVNPRDYISLPSRWTSRY